MACRAPGSLDWPHKREKEEKAKRKGGRKGRKGTSKRKGKGRPPRTAGKLVSSTKQTQPVLDTLPPADPGGTAPPKSKQDVRTAKEDKVRTVIT